MTVLKNINGYLVSKISLKEKKLSEAEKRVIAQGLLLPKNKVSRNGVLYDWDSVKNTYEQIKGLKLMYNHETDGIDAVPIGHATNVWLKEEDDDEGIAGVYYEADLDSEHPQTRKILRGDLDNVSLQVNAEQVVPEYKDGKEYQRAYINDWLEFSVVPCAGMKDATIEARIAEAYKKAKTEEYFKENTTFPYDTFKTGLSDELEEHPNVNPLDAAQLVIDHLKKDINYYSQHSDSEENNTVSKTEEINTSTASGAMAPAVMKDDEEDDTMSKENIKKEEAPIINPEEDETKTEQLDEDEVKEDEVKYESIKKEEYEDDMTSMTEILEQMNGKINSLTEELANLKGQLPQTESAVEDTEADEVKEEQTDDTQVVSDDKTKTDAEVIEESSDEEEIEIDEPIPPITEKKKEYAE
ncbi:MAG: hypothetical protein PHU32_06285, partial [Candidatus ainarchaeum sp.]|nr:hypothetical protein [Candidatus ainarchaeum sp.]